MKSKLTKQMRLVLNRIKSGGEGNELMYHREIISGQKHAYGRFSNGDTVSVKLILALERNGFITKAIQSELISRGHRKAQYLISATGKQA